ncbi:MAG: S8 family serine peptidase [Vicinamibacteria bacterium]
MTSPTRAARIAAACTIALAVPARAQDPLAKDPEGRLSSALYRLAEAAERGRPLASASLPRERTLRRYLDGGTGLVTVVAALEEEADLERVAAAATTVGGWAEDHAGHLVRLRIPPLGLRAISRTPGVRFVRLPQRPRRAEVVSEGVAALRAADFVARTGADGRGIRVGILDNDGYDGGGFGGARALMGRELPEDTIVTSSAQVDFERYDVHGTACAEIVHDVAPGAQLVLASIGDEVAFNRAIGQLLEQRVRIISMSLAWPNQRIDGLGYFEFVVDQVAAQGVLWVNAAGNSAGSYLRGGATDVDRDGLLEFKGRELVPLRAYWGESSVSLRWDEISGRAAEDYDLLVVTDAFREDPRPSADNPAVIASSSDPQNGAGYPWEYAEFELDDTRELYAVVVSRSSQAPGDYRRFSLWVDGEVLEGLAEPSGSVEAPADALGALAVGAIDAGTLALRGFSSRGPTEDGRVKPDLAAPDGVSTSSYYWTSFTGTSAATPHVAGAAALVWSRDPQLTLAQVRELLERATPSQRGSKNNDVGYGPLDLSRIP